nr:hypothetical protein [Mycoplasmopsis bovis]
MQKQFGNKELWNTSFSILEDANELEASKNAIDAGFRHIVSL